MDLAGLEPLWPQNEALRCELEMWRLFVFVLYVSAVEVPLHFSSSFSFPSQYSSEPAVCCLYLKESGRHGRLH